MKNEKTDYKAIKNSSRLILNGGGGGGGTAKTTTSVGLADYYRARGIPVILIDAEDEPKPKGRLKCYFPEAAALHLHSNSSLNDAGKPALNERRLTLVDLGAGAGPRVLEWLRVTQKAFQRNGVPITLICPLTSAPQTLTCVLRWANQLEDAVQYLLIKNDRDQAGFAHLDSQAGKEFIERYKPAVIDLPYRNPEIYSQLEGRNLSPGQALELYNLVEKGDAEAIAKLGPLAEDAILMAHVEDDLNELFAQFDSVIHLLIP